MKPFFQQGRSGEVEANNLGFGRPVKWLDKGYWQTGNVLVDTRCNLDCGDETEVLVMPSDARLPLWLPMEALSEWNPSCHMECAQ